MSSTTAPEAPSIFPDMPLHRLREKRMKHNRDLKILITNRNSETGLGKTTLAVWLALNWDSSWNADEKATLGVRTYLDTYPELDAGSCLLMDEAEQLDARRSQRKENVDFSEQWMMMRVRNITSILTLPTTSALDKRLKELADIRINVVRRGLGKVYRITVDDHDTNEVREWYWHDIEFPNLENHPEMRKLDRMKQKKIQDELNKKYVHIDEFEEAKKNFYNKFTKKTRYSIIRGIHDYCQEHDISLSQKAIGEAIGRYDEDLALSQSRVNQIVKSDGFQEVYNT